MACVAANSLAVALVSVRVTGVELLVWWRVAGAEQVVDWLRGTGVLISSVVFMLEVGMFDVDTLRRALSNVFLGPERKQEQECLAVLCRTTSVLLHLSAFS